MGLVCCGASNDGLPTFFAVAACALVGAQPERAPAFAPLRGEPVKTAPEDAVENMTVIDGIYRTAGLPLRKPA
jgi:hypothetical protein